MKSLRSAVSRNDRYQHSRPTVDFQGLQLGQDVAGAALSRGNIQAILKTRTEKDTK